MIGTTPSRIMERLRAQGADMNVGEVLDLLERIDDAERDQRIAEKKADESVSIAELPDFLLKVLADLKIDPPSKESIQGAVSRVRDDDGIPF